MAVIIEELEAEVAPSPPQPGSAEAAVPEQQAAMDERRVLETITRESWRLRRLEAD